MNEPIAFLKQRKSLERTCERFKLYSTHSSPQTV